MRMGVLAACAVTLVSPAFSQGYDTETITQLRKSYDKCFWASLVAEAKTEGPSKVAMLSERAFQACATEERAIAIYFGGLGAPTNEVEATILKIKLWLKNGAREAAEQFAKKGRQ